MMCRPSGRRENQKPAVVKKNNPHTTEVGLTHASNEASMEHNLEERLTKAIRFFRNFQEKSDKNIYREAVLLFCNLVEQYIKEKNPSETIKNAQEIFGTEAK